MVGWIVARTKGSVACVLAPPWWTSWTRPGTSFGTGIEGDGPRTPAVLRPVLAPHPSAPVPDGPLGPELTPGYAYAIVSVEGFCEGAPSAAAVDATLPNGPHVRLAASQLPASSCATPLNKVVWTSWFESVDQPQPKVLPPSWLEPIVSLPEEAVVGQTMHFTVALQNDFGVPVTLEPCPAYTIGVSTLTPYGKGGPQVVREYALNCASVKTIPPNSAVSFDMQWDVPADAPLTDALWFNWSIGPKEAINIGVLTHPVQLIAPGS